MVVCATAGGLFNPQAPDDGKPDVSSNNRVKVALIGGDGTGPEVAAVTGVHHTSQAARTPWPAGCGRPTVNGLPQAVRAEPPVRALSHVGAGTAPGYATLQAGEDCWAGRDAARDGGRIPAFGESSPRGAGRALPGGAPISECMLARSAAKAGAKGRIMTTFIDNMRIV